MGGRKRDELHDDVTDNKIDHEIIYFCWGYKMASSLKYQSIKKIIETVTGSKLNTITNQKQFYIELMLNPTDVNAYLLEIGFKSHWVNLAAEELYELIKNNDKNILLSDLLLFHIIQKHCGSFFDDHSIWLMLMKHPGQVVSTISIYADFVKAFFVPISNGINLHMCNKHSMLSISIFYRMSQDKFSSPYMIEYLNLKFLYEVENKISNLIKNEDDLDFLDTTHAKQFYFNTQASSICQLFSTLAPEEDDTIVSSTDIEDKFFITIYHELIIVKLDHPEPIFDILKRLIVEYDYMLTDFYNC